MEYRADLHIHTSASDGAFSPTRVVETAASIGLAAIAITDHDTVDGIEEALIAGDESGIEVVPGIEISTVYNEKKEAHILGYFLDYKNNNLLDELRILHEARWERGRRMVERLNEAGVPVNFERVTELAHGGAIGRPHVARAICEVGAASSMDAAFGRYLQEGGPGYVERYKITPFKAIDLIHEAGGVAVCAHVAKLNRDDLLVELVRYGLTGIEVSHPDHGPASERFYRKFAAKHGLIATGGSDAHCIEGDKHVGIGGVTVPYDVVRQLEQAAKKELSS